MLIILSWRREWESHYGREMPYLRAFLAPAYARIPHPYAYEVSRFPAVASYPVKDFSWEPQPPWLEHLSRLVAQASHAQEETLVKASSRDDPTGS